MCHVDEVIKRHPQDLEFIWYSEDQAYVQWTSKSSVRGVRKVQKYLRDTEIKLGELTNNNQASIKNDISLERLQLIADEYDITLWNES